MSSTNLPTSPTRHQRTHRAGRNGATTCAVNYEPPQQAARPRFIGRRRRWCYLEQRQSLDTKTNVLPMAKQPGRRKGWTVILLDSTMPPMASRGDTIDEHVRVSGGEYDGGDGDVRRRSSCQGSIQSGVVATRPGVPRPPVFMSPVSGIDRQYRLFGERLQRSRRFHHQGATAPRAVHCGAVKEGRFECGRRLRREWVSRSSAGTLNTGESSGDGSPSRSTYSLPSIAGYDCRRNMVTPQCGIAAVRCRPSGVVDDEESYAPRLPPRSNRNRRIHVRPTVERAR